MADKKKILIADDFQLLREDLTELINNQRDMEVVADQSYHPLHKVPKGQLP